MLDRDKLILAIEIQARSYKLLKWVAEAVGHGTIPAARAGRHSETPNAAMDWFRENRLLLPAELRPDESRLTEFANFFWTYITTSFDVEMDPGSIRVPVHGCMCELCARIVAAPHLRPKKLRGTDKRRAIVLMQDRVIALASEEGVAIGPRQSTNLIEAL